MADLKQVAERLRVAQTIGKYFAYDGAKDRDQLYSIDQQGAISNWLAERDPTPLTVDALLTFGAKSGDDNRFYFKTFTLEDMFGDIYLLGESWPIRTIGDFYTLVRLAGEKLTQGS